MTDRCHGCFHQDPFCSCPPEDERLIAEAFDGPPEMTERIRLMEVEMMDLDAAEFEREAEIEDARSKELLAQFTEKMEGLAIHETCRINSWEMFWCPAHRRMEERFFCEEHRCYHAREPRP